MNPPGAKSTTAIDKEKVVVEWDADLTHKARVSLIRE